MRGAIIGLILTLAVGLAGPASADIRLSIHDGRVDLAATNASIPQILAAWARVGGTRVVNGNELSSVPVTLQLNGVPEAEALQVILRSAAGFIAVPRPSRVPGASRFERILILATSTPPAAPPPATTPFAAPGVKAQPSAARRVLGPNGLPLADDQGHAPAGAPPSGSPRTPMPPGYPPPPPPPAPAPPAAAPAATPGPGAAQGSPVPGAIVQPKAPHGPGR